MERGDVVATLLLIVIVIIGIVAIARIQESGDARYEELSNPENSLDYLGDGMYACPHCNWTGFPGAMVIVVHDGLLSSYTTHYCPECGHEIDVRGA